MLPRVSGPSKRGFYQMDTTDEAVTSGNLYNQHVSYSTKQTHAYDVMQDSQNSGLHVQHNVNSHLHSTTVQNIDDITSSFNFQHVDAGVSQTNQVYDMYSSKFQQQELEDKEKLDNIYTKLREKQRIDMAAVEQQQRRMEQATHCAEEQCTSLGNCFNVLAVNVWWTGRKKASAYTYVAKKYATQKTDACYVYGVPEYEEQKSIFPFEKVAESKYINLNQYKTLDDSMASSYDQSLQVLTEQDRAVKKRICALASLCQIGSSLTLDSFGVVDVSVQSGKCQEQISTIESIGQDGQPEEFSIAEHDNMGLLLKLQQQTVTPRNLVHYVRVILDQVYEMKEYICTRQILGNQFYLFQQNLTILDQSMLQEVLAKQYAYDGAGTLEYLTTRLGKQEKLEFGKSGPFRNTRSNVEESVYFIRQSLVKLGQAASIQPVVVSSTQDWEAFAQCILQTQTVRNECATQDTKQCKQLDRKVNAVVGKISANQTSMNEGIQGIIVLAHTLVNGLTVSGVSVHGKSAVQYMQLQIVSKLTDSTIDHPSLIFCNAYLLTALTVVFPIIHSLTISAMHNQCYWIVAPNLDEIDTVKKRMLKFQEKTLETGDIVLESIEDYLQRQQHCQSSFYAYISTPMKVGAILCSNLPNYQDITQLLQSPAPEIQNTDKFSFLWTHIARICNSKKPTIVTPLLLQLFVEFAGHTFVTAFRAPAVALLELIHRKVLPWFKSLPKEQIGGEDSKAALAVLLKLLQDTRIPSGYNLHKHPSAEIAGYQQSEVRKESISEYDLRGE